MIRLPPSLLTLGPRDLVEYQGRRQQRELEKIKQQFARFEIGSVDGPSVGQFPKFQSFDSAANASGTDALLSNPAAHDRSLTVGNGYQELRYPIFEGPPSLEDQASLRSDAVSPENASRLSLEEQQSSSPPEHGFHYGGFIESRSPRRSSPFTPEDVSTPQNSSYNRVSQSCKPSIYFTNSKFRMPEFA